MDYQVEMDSLLKKSDGFGTMNMYEVKIQGNDYMLFLYPFPVSHSGDDHGRPGEPYSLYGKI